MIFICNKGVDELERISGYSREQARDVLLEKLQNEIRNEAGIMVRNTLEEAKERSEKEARRILTYAIQRYVAHLRSCFRAARTLPILDLRRRIAPWPENCSERNSHLPSPISHHSPLPAIRRRTGNEDVAPPCVCK